MVVLPDVDWRRRPGLAALIEALGGPAEARYVGGAVRDGLLGLLVSDIDVATRLRPDAVIAALEMAGIKTVPTGVAHGTITAVTGGGPVEVTTLRRDVATDGRHAVVAFSEDWREDASRRDFTINALYADPVSGEVFDWFGGLDDLSARRVRFIGDPLTRIAEDHLRILRFFRFHARFGRGAPDSDGLAACAARANDLMALSRERIAAELLKLLMADDPAPVVATMIDNGILRPVLPEIVDAAPLQRLVERERAFGIAADGVRRLSALIDGRTDFAASIGGRLKLSKAISKRLVNTTGKTDCTPQALAYRLGVEVAIDRLLLGDGTAADIAALDDWRRPVLPISGGHLIARGLTPGPVVAQTLAQIEQRWIDAGFPEGVAFDTILTDELSATH
jgi:poly(A) polymerase